MIAAIISLLAGVGVFWIVYLTGMRLARGLELLDQDS